MNVSAPFIRRPVATILLTLALALAGALAFTRLSIAQRPEVDSPAIYVSAQIPGASPATMATSVATPFERHLSAIAGVNEMSSMNAAGRTSISLRFDLSRDIDGAARDVQAALNAAHADLPSSLRSNPSYSKANIAAAPITYLSLTSKSLSMGKVFEVATNLLQPQLASIQGVGKVDIIGSAAKAVRVELNPDALSKYGVGLEDIRAALAAANANSPKGAIEAGERRYQIYANDTAAAAGDYRSLVVAYRNGLAVRLSEVADIVDSLEDLHGAAVTDRDDSILLRVYRTPGANVIETVDRIDARLQRLRGALPPAVDIARVSDRTATTRASLRDLEYALLIAGALVVLTVFCFLRSLPAIAIPVRTWTLRLTEALKAVPQIRNPITNVKEGALETRLVIDRDTASRLGVSASQIVNTLYDAFGQRSVSTIYGPLTQSHVVMEVAAKYRQSPEAIDRLYVSTSADVASGTQKTNAPAGSVSGAASTSVGAIASDAARNLNLNLIANSARGQTSTGAAVSTLGETMVPLSAMTHFEESGAPMAIGHKGNGAAGTIFFTLAAETPLSEAIELIEQTSAQIHLPASIHPAFPGTARALQKTLANEQWLVVAALVTIYLLLGMLYESLIHPLTILSTLPPAGVGAILALMACRMPFTVIAFVGVILLIGIVMKNAIMMVDVALQLQQGEGLAHGEGLAPREAIHRACLLRFRPIMMTTFAALFGAIPLVLGNGDGAELRQPLGIAIIGGLIVSQALTLYTTPVDYLYLERLSSRRR